MKMGSVVWKPGTSLLLMVALVVVHCRGVQVSVDGDSSVCFDDCNGHGVCVDYQCHCQVGYYGDACEISTLLCITRLLLHSTSV